MERYNRLNEFLKEKFGERVLKISVDGGFSCPNRDGTKGLRGCAFCTGLGSGDHLKHSLSIKEQIDAHIESYRGERANKFIVYFQSFSNTYAPLHKLKQKYDEALSSSNKIVGLAVATRPDLINEEIARLLSSYNDKYYVSVELGLQTANNTTLENLNVKYSSSDFSKAVQILNKYNIDVVAHIMVGLPGETHSDIINTINFLNSNNISGVKIHSTYVAKGTELEKLFQNGNYSPLSLEEYIEEAVYIITHLNKNVVIHRISGDAPKDLLVAPIWNKNKKPIMNGIHKVLEERNLFQGMYN